MESNEPEMAVEIGVSPRGFHEYGSAVTCTYGNTVRVKESSAASGPHVWLFVETGPHMTPDPGQASLHLNPDQARALIERLQTWLDEIPERWNL